MNYLSGTHDVECNVETHLVRNNIYFHQIAKIDNIENDESKRMTFYQILGLVQQTVCSLPVGIYRKLINKPLFCAR